MSVFRHSRASSLWDPGYGGPFFRDRVLSHRRQSGTTCVSTSLAVITGGEPEAFQGGRVNTQDPVSWSDALAPYGMKLAYCPTDLRRLEHYRDELLALDDLFLLCYYSPEDPSAIAAEPDDEGWICSSHVVMLHRRIIHDTKYEAVSDADEYPCWSRFTKRVFRVVPLDHRRGL